MANLGPDQRPEGWNRVPRAYDSMVAPFTGLFAQDALRLANVHCEGRAVRKQGIGLRRFGQQVTCADEPSAIAMEKGKDRPSVLDTW